MGTGRGCDFSSLPYQGLGESLLGGHSSFQTSAPADFLCSANYYLTHLKSISFLKRYEDALDALVCAWVGTRYVEGHADHYGDDDAAIWIP